MRWMVAAALVAGVLAGCGVGTSSKDTSTPGPSRPATTTAATVPTVTTVTTATTTTETTTTPVAAGSCALDDPGFRAGGALDCIRRGADVHIVHEHDILTLTSVLARLLAVNQTSEIAGTTRSFTAKGTFVRVTLAITNTTHTPRSIRAGQTALVIGARQLDEVVALENGQDGRSLLSRAGPDHPLAPGASVTGEVVFDVPLKLSGSVPKAAWIAIAGFGASRSPNHRRAVGGIALGA